MEKSDIEKYLNKLLEFEKILSTGESKDTNYITELNEMLNKLGKDVESEAIYNTNQMEVKIKKLHPDAVIPVYSKEGDAGLDLTITQTYSNTTFDVTYGFGIAMEIPMGYVGLIFPRSSIRKTDLLLTNCVGVIDSGYRGEIQATFKKTQGLDSIKYKVGERGAQIVIMPYPKIKFVEVNELSSTERGDGGFGSTGS
jgi:dUTP pyrophosphatase